MKTGLSDFSPLCEGGDADGPGTGSLSGVAADADWDATGVGEVGSPLQAVTRMAEMATSTGENLNFVIELSSRNGLAEWSPTIPLGGTLPFSCP